MQRTTGFIFIFLFFTLAVCPTRAQVTLGDSTKKVKILNPRKATLYSTFCPGLGQIYNGRTWKAVIIYAGFAGITYGLIFNQQEFRNYQDALNVRFDTLSSTVDNRYPELTDGTVQSLRNYHRRNRDICILAFAGLYALNIIDANVDANLQEFRINKDLSLNWHPDLQISRQGQAYSTINLTLKF